MMLPPFRRTHELLAEMERIATRRRKDRIRRNRAEYMRSLPPAADLPKGTS